MPAHPPSSGGGHSHIEVTGMCGHDAESTGLSVTRLNKEKRGVFQCGPRKIGGHLVRTIKKKGSFSENFSLK